MCARLVDPATASEYAYMLAPVTNAEDITAGKKKPEELAVKAIDPETFEVTLNAPTPYFLEMLTHQSTYPVSKANIDKLGADFVKPGNLVSNGAYVLTEFVPNDHIKAVKNDKFYDAANVKIDVVNFIPTEDRSTAMKRFEAAHRRGVPIIALRTSTHVFNFPANSPWAAYSWNNKTTNPGGFGKQVFGETWVSHWGKHKVEATRGVIEPGAIESEWSGIAADEAERYSGRGAYAGLVASFRKFEARSRKSPPPRVISDLIVKALRAKRPATRYHGGGLSGTLLFLRRWLSDRTFDRLLMSAFR